VLVLVEGQSIRAVLVMIDAVLALLTKLEVLAEGPLHHHLLAACADTGDVPLCIYHQYLQKPSQIKAKLLQVLVLNELSSLRTLIM